MESKPDRLRLKILKLKYYIQNLKILKLIYYIQKIKGKENGRQELKVKILLLK